MSYIDISFLNDYGEYHIISLHGIIASQLVHGKNHLTPDKGLYSSLTTTVAKIG